MKTNALMMIAAAAFALSAFAEPFVTADFTQRTGKVAALLELGAVEAGRLRP